MKQRRSLTAASRLPQRKKSMHEPCVITREHPDPQTARLFAEADLHPVLVTIADKRYRIERVEHYLYYHPEERQGTTDDDAERIERRKEDFRRIIREAKPNAKSLEWGPETRYGREDDFNNGYNEALDEYEAALLRRFEEGNHDAAPAGNYPMKESRDSVGVEDCDEQEEISNTKRLE